jgi:hypothetical protein
MGHACGVEGYKLRSGRICYFVAYCVVDLEIAPQASPEFRWRQSAEFLKFVVEMAAIEISKFCSDLFYAQERLSQHSFRFSHP